MSTGFDTNHNVAHVAQEIKNAGMSFVGRYYNVNNHAKNLTIAEAEALSKAGLYIVSVWENGFPTHAGYFSFEQGIEDGLEALKIATQMGQPKGTPIYFAVDFDALVSDQPKISDYFRGVRSKLFDASAGELIHLVGVYGNGYVCQTLLDAGFVHYTWLSQSMGWNGSQEFTGWNIKQGGYTTVAGIEGDSDVTAGAGGGWMLKNS